MLVLRIPPLRERGADTSRLAEHFLERFAAAPRPPRPKRLDEGGRAWLAAYPWPGNVRELEHLMERVTLLGPEGDIGRQVLEAHGAEPPAAPPAPQRVPMGSAGGGTEDDGQQIRRALARSGGNVVRAARLLGIGRNALRYRMRRLGIERPDIAAEEEAPPPPVAAPRPAGGPPRRAWEEKPVAVLAVALALPQLGAGEQRLGPVDGRDALGAARSPSASRASAASSSNGRRRG